jgi:hypothetical protein
MRPQGYAAAFKIVVGVHPTDGIQVPCPAVYVIPGLFDTVVVLCAGSVEYVLRIESEIVTVGWSAVVPQPCGGVLARADLARRVFLGEYVPQKQSASTYVM